MHPRTEDGTFAGFLSPRRDAVAPAHGLPPQVERFQALCDAVDRAARDEPARLERSLCALHEAMDRWPLEHLPSPSDVQFGVPWSRALAGFEPPPWLALTRRLWLWNCPTTTRAMDAPNPHFAEPADPQRYDAVEARHASLVARYLAETPGIERLRVLEVQATAPLGGPAGLFALLRCPRFIGIEKLSIIGLPCALDRNGVLFEEHMFDALGRASALRSLRALWLGSYSAGPDDWARLFSHAAWPTLREFRTLRTKLGARGAEALAGWRLLAGLRALELPDAALHPHGIEALFTRGRFDALERLALRGHLLRDEDAVALASAALPSLQSLEIGQSTIAGPPLAALLRAPWTKGLARLSLQGCKLGASDVTELSSCATLGALRVLVLKGTGLSAKARKMVAANPALASCSIES